MIHKRYILTCIKIYSWSYGIYGKCQNSADVAKLVEFVNEDVNTLN